MITNRPSDVKSSGLLAHAPGWKAQFRVPDLSLWRALAGRRGQRGFFETSKVSGVAANHLVRAVSLKRARDERSESAGEGVADAVLFVWVD
ncbi:hypothetical protein [Haladaptatus sp. W1]|uniref:hypothetical protein n=1 Tax=Haladaptatus sp. W1 TaxID=1897478 RepID=UPI001112CB1F|nr:hypothetical protein [Haladaptatus sp. W1]